MTKRQAVQVADAVSRYKGEYVLFRGTSVVAHHSDLHAAMNSVRPAERKGLTVRYAPERDFTNSTFSSL